MDLFLSENQSDLVFDNLNSECEEVSTPTDVFDISVFVTGEMDSLSNYLESESIVKEFVEESMAKSEELIVSSPPAKKCKIDPLALLALHSPAAYKKAINDQKIRQEKADLAKKSKENALALLALHSPAAYKKAILAQKISQENLAQRMNQEKVDLDQPSDEEEEDEEDDERNWDNSEWDEDCEAESSVFGVDENKDEAKDDESWKKSIREGDDYQASVPDDIFPYDDPSLDHNEDKKLWEPDQLSEDDVKEYLAKYTEAVGEDKEQIKEDKWDEICATYKSACENNTKEDFFREDKTVDNEQALYLLLQCGYNTEEALRRAKLLRRLLLKQKYLAKKNCNVMSNVPVEDY